jgi:hypothetical protein
MISIADYPFLPMAVRMRTCRLTLEITESTKKDFMKSVRAVSEAIFYVLLMSYRNSLQVNYELSSTQEQKSSPNTLMWLDAMEHAEKALKTAVEAASVHAAGRKDQAAKLAQEASEALKKRLVV